ncbi:translation initiation factor IF-2 subunit alpha [archaeon]|jgi:translation initiation factor 2 subunit 1|nr:translation initiation factor IF-2 subunit alpha [archaeon]MBT4396976.1 translation initiation factor IF-2 subunit alpha [archaeon]MBT4440967.1 translation initiation factor IF-2 subunit alpha [archaeon]
MFYKKKGLPRENEIVICTVKKILYHSIFVDLDEYEKQDGMIHISEIAPGRIRNIRDYVKEGKKLVCVVLRVNEKQKQVDLSLRRVSMSLRNKKNDEFKQEIKAEKLMESVAKQQKTTLLDYYKNVGFKLIEEFDLLSHAFFEISAKGEEVIADLELPSKYTKLLVETIQDKIKPPEVLVGAFVNLQNPSENGIEEIKKVLIAAEEFAKKNEYKMGIVYISAPRYRIESYSSDYKTAQEQLEKVCDKIQKGIKKSKGSYELIKKK